MLPFWKEIRSLKLNSRC